jgi:hypothetical protein
MNEIIPVTGLSNQEFLEKYARPGCIGLSGGVSLIDRVIRRAERHVGTEKEWSQWSHALLFQGRRLDGHHWVIESDLQVIRKHISLGVQENRVTKYHDETLYSWLAVLDFNLSEEQTRQLLREGLELVANRTRYSLRELLGTLITLRRPELRGGENVLAREKSLYCSAFVHHVFSRIGVALVPDIHVKNTSPEDISRTLVPHTTYVLEREVAETRWTELPGKLRRNVRERIQQRVAKRRVR